VPAKTTNQLYQTHGQYLDAAESGEEAFNLALNEVMPRIYKMGYWREMLVEHTQDASAGYVSLPQDTDSIVAGVLDNSAIPTRSLWHDYKLFGTNKDDRTDMTAFIDDGYAPTYRDLVAGNEYMINIVTLKVGVNIPNTSQSSVVVKYRRYSDATSGSGGANALTGSATVLESDSYNEDSVVLFDQGYPNYGLVKGHDDITEILSISWSNLTEDHPLRVQAIYKGTAGGAAATDATKDLILADLNTANGSSRYRRFRVGGTNSTSSAHMLLKRKWVDVDSNTDLVHMPANAILKHALLGKLAEDNADIQRASYHWGLVAQLLETDTDSYRGAAKPTLHVAPGGIGAGMSGMY